MFSSPTKRTVLIITQRSHRVRAEPRGLFIYRPLINPPAFLSAFITVGMKRAPQLPVLGSLSTTLTRWPSGLSHTFPKASQTLRLNAAACHKPFLSFFLALSLIVERRIWAFTDGVWVCFCLCLCGYECFNGLYVSVISQFGQFILRWLVHSPEVWMLFCYTLDP